MPGEVQQVLRALPAETMVDGLPRAASSKVENDEFSEIVVSAKACSTRFPGGNLVDGLPPVASNATGVKSSSLRPKLSMAGRCFNRDVLGIQPSDLHQIAREPTGGTRQGSARSSGHSTSRIRRSTGEQVSSHERMVMRFMIIGRQARPVAVPGLRIARRRAMILANDSQSSPASV